MKRAPLVILAAVAVRHSLERALQSQLVAQQKIHMRIVLVLVGMLSAAQLFGQQIIETRNVPLAITLYSTKPQKAKFVDSRRGLAKLDQKPQCKTAPAAAQTFDHSKTTIGLRLEVTTVGDKWTYAPVVIVADGRQVYSSRVEWTSNLTLGGQWRQDSMVESDVSLIRTLSKAMQVFVTVTLDSTQVSFQLTPETLTDCGVIVAKFDELTALNAAK